MTRDSRDELKARARVAIERRSDDIVALAKELWRYPEIGFQEVRTSDSVCRELAILDITYRAGLAITGVKARVSGGAPGPTVAVLGVNALGDWLRDAFDLRVRTAR